MESGNHELEHQADVCFAAGLKRPRPFSTSNLRRAYYNRWRAHQSLGQIEPNPHVGEVSRTPAKHLISKPVLGGLHYVY